MLAGRPKGREGATASLESVSVVVLSVLLALPPCRLCWEGGGGCFVSREREVSVSESESAEKQSVEYPEKEETNTNPHKWPKPGLCTRPAPPEATPIPCQRAWKTRRGRRQRFHGRVRPWETHH